jgi:hypothetical protein
MVEELVSGSRQTVSQRRNSLVQNDFLGSSARVAQDDTDVSQCILGFRGDLRPRHVGTRGLLEMTRIAYGRSSPDREPAQQRQQSSHRRDFERTEAASARLRADPPRDFVNDPLRAFFVAQFAG